MGARAGLAGLVADRNAVFPQGARISAVSRSRDHLDIFATDSIGRVLTAAWEPAFTDGWHGWWDLKGGRAKPGAPVTAVSRSADKLDVFVTGTDGGCYTAAWEPGFTDWWHGWWRVRNAVFPQGSNFGAVSRSADHLDIFGTDTAGRSSPRRGSRRSPTAGTAGGRSEAA